MYNVYPRNAKCMKVPSPDTYEEEQDRDIVRANPDYRYRRMLSVEVYITLLFVSLLISMHIRTEMRECIFNKGQSRRIWNELYKV